MIYLIAGAFIFSLALLLLRRRESALPPPKRQFWTTDESRQAGWRSQSAQSSIGIPATKEMLDEEQAAIQETFSKLKDRMVSSDVFVPEKISALIAILRDASQPFSRVNTSVAYQGKTVLTVAEKSALNLNTRMKYTGEYIAFFLPEKLPGLEPKSFLADMHLAAFNEVRNSKELAKLKRSSLVTRVAISSCGDARDCAEVKNIRGNFALDDAPALPLPGCDAPYCRCFYMPIV